MSKKGRETAFKAFQRLAREGTAPAPDGLVEKLQARRAAAAATTPETPETSKDAS